MVYANDISLRCEGGLKLGGKHAFTSVLSEYVLGVIGYRYRFRELRILWRVVRKHGYCLILRYVDKQNLCDWKAERDDRVL